MSKVLKKLFVTMCLCMLVFAFGTIEAKASERTLISVEELDNGWTLSVYEETSNANVRTKSTGTTKYFRYSTPSDVVICEVSVTIAFNYENDDGYAKITSFTYGTTYLAPGFSVSFYNESITHGRPSVARISYNIYKNGSVNRQEQESIYCYNNGTMNWH